MILEFFGTECPHCHAMKPIIERLKQEGVQFESYEIWHNEDNASRMNTYDKKYCGGVPFYVNPKTGKWICGECTYEELKAIA
jgi:thiol-disulfide isomerase/thioredoxin